MLCYLVVGSGFRCYATCEISIAVTIGSSIAFAIRSVDRSFDLRWGFNVKYLSVTIHFSRRWRFQ